MAYARMKALDTYLESCKDLPNFSEVLENQCVQVVKEVKGLSSLALDEAAPLLALLQQNVLWPTAMKETISRAIQAKVQESMQIQHRGMKERASLQDFTWFPVYLSQSDWNAVLDDTLSLGQRCSVIMNRLCKLGLKYPSEDTYAMVTTVLLIRDQLIFSDGLQLRSNYLSVKGLMKAHLNSLKCTGTQTSEAGDYLVQLPPTPATLDSALRSQAFGDSESPASLPDGITMENLQQNMLLVPQRSNSRLLQLQVPKASGPAAFMPMNMQMNMMQLAVQQMAAQQMAVQQFAAQQLAAQQAMSTPAIGDLAQRSTALALPSSSSQLALPPTPAASTKEVEVVPPRPETPSKKAALALTDGAPESSEEKEKKAPAGAVTVAQKLELALSMRNDEKKEKKSTETAKKNEETTEDREDSKTPKKFKQIMKRPAAAKAKTVAKPKTSTQSQKAASKEMATAKAKPSDMPKTLKRPASAMKLHCKGPITRMQRVKLKPQGCSSCRWVRGCCDSCWIKRKYRVV